MAESWVRLWSGMTTDPKWQTVARKSGQPRCLVIALFTHLMLEANEAADRGSLTDVDVEDVASTLDCDEEAVVAILNAMQGRVIDDGRLSGWDRRQPVREDSGNPQTGALSSTERSRLHRERKRSATQCNARNDDATQCNAPEAEAEADKPFVNQRQQSETEEACETPTAAAATDPVVGRAIELTALLRRRGADLQASDPRVRGWASSGVTDAQALAALERAQEQRAARGSPQPINAGLLSAILTDITTQTEGPNHGQPRRPSAADRRAAVVAELTGANRRAAQDQHDPHARTLDGQARVVR